MVASTSSTKTICLALQGGGSHGAFTWGVLDRLLEEESIDIQAVSGTSAGAMNAAVLTDALKSGHRHTARLRLEAFWRCISDAGSGVFRPGRMVVPGVGGNQDWSPIAVWSEMVSLVWSPYDNPFYDNLLAGVVTESLPDFDAINDARTPYTFICATDVRTNQRKIFGPGEITADSLLASACLPTLFRAVDVNGHTYWDGGYLGNPALEPLRSPALAPDLVIVWVNPLYEQDIPTNARAIQNRLNEITFNAALVGEMREIEAINELRPRTAGAPYKHVRLHQISDQRYMSKLGYVSKTNTDWTFLTELRGVGRATAERWL
ncbi:MAG TPA: patatin-like phospholipase family protein, partial [Vicinamibacterales bacterium]|nr:patatin-like phospholipase family protein [Vicinamibacterales bacterium]